MSMLGLENGGKVTEGSHGLEWGEDAVNSFGIVCPASLCKELPLVIIKITAERLYTITSPLRHTLIDSGACRHLPKFGLIRVSHGEFDSSLEKENLDSLSIFTDVNLGVCQWSFCLQPWMPWYLKEGAEQNWSRHMRRKREKEKNTTSDCSETSVPYFRGLAAFHPYPYWDTLLSL